jgi:uncharacterized protein YgiM (DUF1202 family)
VTRRVRLLPVPLAVACATLVAACGSSAPTPSATAAQSVAPSASPTPKVIGSQRTVLSQLGLNLHSSPDTSSSVVATAAQGTVLTVQDYQASNGGFYKVQGSSTTGWIVADPMLTASGAYQSYSSSERGFSVLIPQTWTFAEEPADVLFRPQQGQQTIVVRTGANTAAMGSEAPSGYTQANSQQEIICGYTGQLDFYTSGGTAAQATPSPSGSPASAAQRLSGYAAVRLRFDATHTMEIAFNYQSKDQLSVFQDFYNSISFPFPLCQAPLPSSSAAPAT